MARISASGLGRSRRQSLIALFASASALLVGLVVPSFAASAGASAITAITGLPTGTVTTFASGLPGPTGVAFDAAGNMYVAMADSGQILEYAPGSVTPTVFATGVITPMALAFDSNGYLYAAELEVGGVAQIAPNGTVNQIVEFFHAPITGVAFDANGNLYESDVAGNVYRFASLGGSPRTFTNPSSPFASLPTSTPAGGIRFDAYGNLYIAGPRTGDIYRVGPSGGVAQVYESGLGAVLGLRFDSSGNLFATVGCNPDPPLCGSVVEFSPNGATITLIANNIDQPYGLAFDPNGILFVGEPNSGVVQKITLQAPAPTTVYVTRTTGTLTATWNASPTATSYTCTLMYGFNLPSTFKMQVTSTSCIFSGLDPQTNYGVGVSANVGGLSSSRTVAFPNYTPPVKTTITCVKGRSVKHVTGYGPVCPPGYTQKK